MYGHQHDHSYINEIKINEIVLHIKHRSYKSAALLLGKYIGKITLRIIHRISVQLQFVKKRAGTEIT